METNDGHRVGVPALGRGLGRHPETQGQVIHGVDNDALVLVRVLGDATQARLAHVVAVEVLEREAAKL